MKTHKMTKKERRLQQKRARDALKKRTKNNYSYSQRAKSFWK